MLHEAIILDVGAETFEREVVERSRTMPVLIDFWATWCGPCKALSPTLEKLAREMAGRFALAKVDIDKNLELADLFRIQSVPAVLLLKEGRLVDGFLGALPEAQVRKFLERHLGAAALDPFEQAKQLEAAGDRAGALAALRALVSSGKGEGAPRVMLARLLAADGRVEEAKKVFAKVAGADLESDEARAVRAQLEGSAKTGDIAALERAVAANASDVAARLALGKALVAAGRHEPGLEHLLQAAKLDLAFEGGAPRKAMIEVFNLLGQADPLTLEYQRRLSMLLCV
jgi:putative thioredoxin